MREKPYYIARTSLRALGLNFVELRRGFDPIRCRLAAPTHPQFRGLGVEVLSAAVSLAQSVSPAAIRPTTLALSQDTRVAT